MSINLYLYAVRKVYNADGKYIGLQKEKFELYQTQTDTTFEIMEALTLDEKVKRYCLFIKSQYNVKSNHGKRLKAWIKQRQKEEYTVEFYYV